MAAAIVDLNINEGETWEMQVDFWENDDNTLPIDLTGWSFKGAMNFTSRCIPMSFNVFENAIVARIEANELVNLPTRGTYAIEADNGTDVTRVLQGNIVVDKVAVCS